MVDMTTSADSSDDLAALVKAVPPGSGLGVFQRNLLFHHTQRMAAGMDEATSTGIYHREWRATLERLAQPISPS
jgi:hypothetical protein